MIKRLLPCALLTPLTVVAIVVSSAACGTMANFNEGRYGLIATYPDHRPKREYPVPYGGVLADIEQPNWKKSDEWTKEQVVFGTPLLLIDMGLSAVLDTATLPIVWWINLRKAYDRAFNDKPKTIYVDTEPMPKPEKAEPKY
jgi:uncharacterized protein YceK